MYDDVTCMYDDVMKGFGVSSACYIGMHDDVTCMDDDVTCMYDDVTEGFGVSSACYIEAAGQYYKTAT